MPADGIDKLILIAEGFNGLVLALAHGRVAAVVVIGFHGFQCWGLPQGIAVAPVEAEVAVDVNAVDVVSHQGSEVEDAIAVGVALILAIGGIHVAGDHVVAFGIEGWDEPHVEEVDPLCIRLVGAVGEDFLDVAQGDLDSQNLLGVHLSHKEQGGFLFIVFHVVRDTHGIDGQVVLLGIADQNAAGDIRVLGLVIGQHLRDLIISVVTGGQIGQLGP